MLPFPCRPPLVLFSATVLSAHPSLSLGYPSRVHSKACFAPRTVFAVNTSPPFRAKAFVYPPEHASIEHASIRDKAESSPSGPSDPLPTSPAHARLLDPWPPSEFLCFLRSSAPGKTVCYAVICHRAPGPRTSASSFFPRWDS